MLPQDANHALMVGRLVGLVMRDGQELGVLGVRICDDEAGNHQTHFEIDMPSGTYTVTVSKNAMEEVST